MIHETSTDQTWPGTYTFPLYSTGSNGLPLAYIARPCECKMTDEKWTDWKFSDVEQLPHEEINNEALFYLAPRVGFFGSTFRLRGRI